MTRKFLAIVSATALMGLSACESEPEQVDTQAGPEEALESMQGTPDSVSSYTPSEDAEATAEGEMPEEGAVPMEEAE